MEECEKIPIRKNPAVDAFYEEVFKIQSEESLQSDKAVETYLIRYPQEAQNLLLESSKIDSDIFIASIWPIESFVDSKTIKKLTKEDKEDFYVLFLSNYIQLLFEMRVKRARLSN